MVAAFRHPIALLAVATLAACGPSNQTELRQWMAEVRRGVKPVVQPVPAPKSFTPHQFADAQMVDPFDAQKVQPAVGRAPARAGGKQPDLDRRRETLEAFPLDQLRMVGVMKQGGTQVALITVDGATHLVRIGNHVGQNFGRVVSISETEMKLVETVQDAAGDWVARPARLELQESAARPQGAKR